MESVGDCPAELVVEQEFSNINDPSLALAHLSVGPHRPCDLTCLHSTNQNENYSPSDNFKVPDSALEDRQESSEENSQNLTVDRLLSEEEKPDTHIDAQSSATSQSPVRSKHLIKNKILHHADYDKFDLEKSSFPREPTSSLVDATDSPRSIPCFTNKTSDNFKCCAIAYELDDQKENAFYKDSLASNKLEEELDSEVQYLVRTSYSDNFRADLFNNNAIGQDLEVSHEQPTSDSLINENRDFIDNLSGRKEVHNHSLSRGEAEASPKKVLVIPDTLDEGATNSLGTSDKMTDKLLTDVSELSDLLNSPVLRRTLLTPETERIDCRVVFSEEIPTIDENSDKIESKKYRPLRDSLDMVKAKNLLSSPTKNEQSPLFIRMADPPICINMFEKLEEESSDVLERITQVPYPSPVPQRKDKGLVVPRDRRVSFPKDDTSLITSYLEPANPWCKMNDVTTEEISKAYCNSCEKHQTAPLPIIMRQITALPLCIGGRIECLSLRNYKLDLNQCECLEEIFRRVQFKSLIFEGCGLDDDSVIPLFDMIEFYDSATQINISCNDKITQRGWQACARMLKRTPSIYLLNAHSTNLSEQNMPILAKAIRLGTRLHTLHLENCNLTGRPLMILTGALKVNEIITDLYLADNRLGANDCIQIGNLIRSNRAIKLLDLRNNNIQDTGCSHICEGIVDQKKKYDQMAEFFDYQVVITGLGGLVLWNNHLTIQSVPHISTMLQSGHKLEILNIGRNSFTSEAILQLKSSLIRNHFLKQLGLQATRIGNEGAVALAEYIADNVIVERIDLRENAIHVAGLMALSQSLRINKTVIQVDLDNHMKAEPSYELVTQHELLQQEIKGYCQRNHTASQIKETPPLIEEVPAVTNTNSTTDLKSRKISLTCDSTILKEKSELIANTNEPKKYWSPAPSPSLSPCPSPSLSPSPSPVPSPSRSRFEVFRVTEKSIADSSYSQSINTNVLSISAPASYTMPSLSCSLPSLVQPSIPNRFSPGGRFTVTRVKEEPTSFKSSLPTMRTMSSPSLIISDPKEELRPTIVVSSPNKPIKGFNVPEETNNLSGTHNESKFVNSITNIASLDAAQNPKKSEAFVEDPLDKFLDSDLNNHPTEDAIFTSTAFEELPFKAPLALMEAESFDSDSEDSEVTTQSSDSTHSDEVKIGVDQVFPVQAWGIKDDDKPENIAEDKKSIVAKDSC